MSLLLHVARVSDPCVRRARLGEPCYTVLLVLCTALGPTAFGQGVQDDPTGGEPPADGAADDAAEQEVDLSQYGPAVRAVLGAERRTPEELLQGVILLLDLGEPDLAKPLFAKLMAADLDDAARAALARKFGSHRMIRLARSKTLGPEVATFVDQCTAALAAEVRDPKRLTGLVQKLDDPSPDVRIAALSDLVEGGSDAAAFCVAALVDPEHAARHDGLLAALVELRPASVEPLLSAMAVTEPEAKVAVIGALAVVEPGRAMPYLIAPAMLDPDPNVRQTAAEALMKSVGRLPTPAEAEATLARSADAYLAGRLPAPPDEAGLVEVWTWDAADRKPVSQKLLPKDASVLAASRLAADLASLAPQNADYQINALLCYLQAAKLATGLDTPLADSEKKATAKASTALLSGVLRRAMERDLVPAAIAAAELLGERGDLVAIYGPAPHTSPLVDALRHADRRLSYTALRAIIGLDPRDSFSGASRVTDALADFLRSGQRHAVVAMPNLQRAQTVAAWLAAGGVEGQATGSGRAAVRAVLASPGAEFILIDASIANPGVREVLYQLRGIPSDGRAPIGLLAGPGEFDRARQIADGDAWAASFARPQNQAAAEQIVAELVRLEGRHRVPVEVRGQHAADALEWIDRLLSEPLPFYELQRLEPMIRSALGTPELAGRATTALGRFGSADSQRALVNLASNPNMPIERRNAAASAFRQSTARYGIQLTKQEILRQYDRYNASETAQRPTQEVLGHVLDTIEGKVGSGE